MKKIKISIAIGLFLLTATVESSPPILVDRQTGRYPGTLNIIASILTLPVIHVDSREKYTRQILSTTSIADM